MGHWRKSGRQPAGGAADHRPQGGKYAPLPPLPARSVLQPPNPYLHEDQSRDRAVLSVVVVFFSLVFLIPMLLIGVMHHFQ